MIFKREGQAGQAGQDGQDGRSTLPARTVLVAAGTSPNITYEKEAPGTFQLDAKKKFFQPHSVVETATAGSSSRPIPSGFFTSHDAGGRFVTYYGDNHPRYAGNVVKAMASAKDGFPHVTRLFARELASLDPARQAGARRGVDAADRAARRRADRARRRGRAADADDRRGDREGAGRRAALPARAVLSAAELRVGGAARRRRAAADGRDRADRRVGRQGARAAVADRARARRVEPAGRAPAARASRSS